jgi:hypothetical protein
MQRSPTSTGKRSKKVSKVIMDGQKTQARLTTKTPSKRTRAWAKKLLDRRAGFPPWMVAELEKFAAGEPYVTAIDVIYKQRK